MTTTPLLVTVVVLFMTAAFVAETFWIGHADDVFRIIS